MYINPYRNSAPYELRQRVDDLKKKMSKELENEELDINKINKIQEALYMPDLFNNCFIGYERFKSPW